ncbi:MAG TPA: transposase [Gaiellaceae bacterium]|nr:transposase [Gaiellaceae bacterium]
MPSPPRDLAPGVSHVWVNATGKEQYFLDHDDRVTWIRLLCRTLDRYAWTCVAFCQMSTHVHLILDVPDRSLALGMKDLNMGYSRDFNARHERGGQFVRRRYRSRRIASGRDLIGAYAYVVLNPVAAGISLRPEDWRWSSYATTLGLSDDFPFVDGTLAVAEAGGYPDRLRAAIESRQRENVSRSATAGV